MLEEFGFELICAFKVIQHVLVITEKANLATTIFTGYIFLQ